MSTVHINHLQCSLAHQLLPKEQQTKPEEVRARYDIFDKWNAKIH